MSKNSIIDNQVEHGQKFYYTVTVENFSIDKSLMKRIKKEGANALFNMFGIKIQDKCN